MLATNAFRGGDPLEERTIREGASQGAQYGGDPTVDLDRWLDTLR